MEETKKLLLKRCPVCYSPNINFAFSVKNKYDDLTKNIFGNKSYSIFKCTFCNCEFLNPQPNKNEIIKIYEEIYRQKKLSKVKARSAISKYLVKKRNELIKQKEISTDKLFFWPLIYTFPEVILMCKDLTRNSSKSVLDVGCGDGSLLLLLKDVFGYKDLMGMDFSKRSVEICRKKGLETTRSDLSTIKDKFDLITLIHVLEHIPNPSIFVKTLSKLLKKDGIIIISLPNANSLGKVLFNQGWSGYNIPKHYVNYSKKGVINLFINKGMNLARYRTRGIYVNSLNSRIKNENAKRIVQVVHNFFHMIPSYLYFGFGDEQTFVFKND